MFPRHVAVPVGRPTTVRPGLSRRGLTAPADLSETNRRLSQYPAPAKKTPVTCSINRGLWSGRGPAVSKGPAACGDRGCGPGKYDELFTLGWNAFDLFRTNRMRQSRTAGQPCRRKRTGQPDIQTWLLIQRRADTRWLGRQSEFWSALLQNHRSLTPETCRKLSNIRVSMRSKNGVWHWQRANLLLQTDRMPCVCVCVCFLI